MKELVYHRLLLPSANRNANKPCVTNAATGVTSTFAEHLERVGRAAAALQQLGVGRSDRFAVLALNSPEYLELYHAAFLGAGVINPLNLRFAPAELAYVLKDSGSTVCFVDALFAPVIESVKEEAGLSTIVLIGDGDLPGAIRYEELLASIAPEIPDEGEESDPVILMYTGGTTGMPKGVLLDQRAEMLNMYHVMMTLGWTNTVVNLIQTPMFHAATMFGITGAPAIGAHTVILPGFEPSAVLRAIDVYQPNATVMVPTMIGLLMAHAEFTPEALAPLKDLVYGASPMPQALLEKVLALYPDMDIWQGYGMTECSAVLTLLGPTEHRAGGDYLRSAGKPMTGVVLSIRDEEDNELGPGETGEVCARSGNFMVEYWNKPEATDEAFRNGWYRSGDEGYLDEDGYLFLVDRVKDMIVTGGENVYSIEVENALASHAAVQQVAVIGIPHDVWGEMVHAVVVLKDKTMATAEDLIEHARSRIAGYKVPKSVEFRKDPLPLSGAMKVLKRELREPYWKNHERGIS